MSRDVYIIPCGAAKLDEAAPARALYTGSAFRLALEAAEAQGGRVLILSALHGLIDPDDVLAPYDVKMGDAESIAVDALALQVVSRGLVGRDVYAMLPRRYFEALDAAAKPWGVYVQDVYEANRGIGEQRGIAACCRDHADDADRAAGVL